MDILATGYDSFSDFPVFPPDTGNGTAVDIFLSCLKKHKGLTPKNIYLEQFKIIGE